MSSAAWTAASIWQLQFCQQHAILFSEQIERSGMKLQHFHKIRPEDLFFYSDILLYYIKRQDISASVALILTITTTLLLLQVFPELKFVFTV